jgi:hypothetical protein
MRIKAGSVVRNRRFSFKTKRRTPFRSKSGLLLRRSSTLPGSRLVTSLNRLGPEIVRARPPSKLKRLNPRRGDRCDRSRRHGAGPPTRTHGTRRVRYRGCLPGRYREAARACVARVLPSARHESRRCRSRRHHGKPAISGCKTVANDDVFVLGVVVAVGGARPQANGGSSQPSSRLAASLGRDDGFTPPA